MARVKASSPADLAKQGFARRLIQIRESAGFASAADFARHIGVEIETYRRWERGETEPGIANMARILSAAHASAEFLVLGKVPAQPTSARSDS